MSLGNRVFMNYYDLGPHLEHSYTYIFMQSLAHLMKLIEARERTSSERNIGDFSQNWILIKSISIRPWRRLSSSNAGGRNCDSGRQIEYGCKWGRNLKSKGERTNERNGGLHVVDTDWGPLFTMYNIGMWCNLYTLPGWKGWWVELKWKGSRHTITPKNDRAKRHGPYRNHYKSSCEVFTRGIWESNQNSVSS